LFDLNILLSKINQACVVGFYITPNALAAFSDCKFHIPNKMDWLIAPHKNVNWQSFEQFKERSNDYLARQFSPLCWLKKPNGEIEKFFLVWWT
jgi:hypothetical protein